MKESDSSKRERRHFSGQQKSAIVKAQLIDGKSVADLCDQHFIQPTQFYQWQKQLFKNGDTAFERKAKPGESMSASIAFAVVNSTAEPVFAVRLSGEIVAWNDSADRLFGFSSEQISGKPCYEVLQGRDAFGNSYCVERCPVRVMVQQLKRVSHFELVYQNAAGSGVPIAIWPLVVPTTDGEEEILVHLLQPKKLADLVSDCGENDDHLAAADDLVHRLTPRQIEVLRLLAAGLSTSAIAERLFISKLTVRNHVENVLHKLEVHSRLEAVSVAHHSGLV